AGRADPRRARRGPAGRQLLAGRRLEGHLGARQRPTPHDRGGRAARGAPGHGGAAGHQPARHRAGPAPAAGAAAADPSGRRGLMLSRIAESLFWIGRYVERADDTARILDAHLQLLLEDPWVEEDLACRSLLAVMGATAPAEDVVVTRQDVLDTL